MDLYYIVDRIEGNFAVLETPEKNFIDIALSQLPEGIKPGDYIVKNNDNYTIDTKKTAEQNQIVLERMKKLWK